MESNIPPPKGSATQIWLMIFCWLVPGLALLGGFTFSFWISYPGTSGIDYEVINIALLVVLVAVLIGSGVFCSLLRITRLDGSDAVTPRRIAAQTLLFCFGQVFVAPFVAISMVLGCGAISSLF